MQSPGHRLSESPLWQWQRNYFARQGVRAWSQNVVPDFVTNNAFTARAFARVIRARILDYLDTCGDQAPERVYILEAGAGSGRFAFRFLHFLQADPLPCPVTFVLTDFAESILDFWRQHPRLQPHFQSGLLDLALYDAASKQPIRLEISGRELGPGSLGSPLLLIGNYYLDSLPHDLFRLESGQLLEGRVSFSEPEEGGEAGLDQVNQSLSYQPLDMPAYPVGDPLAEQLNAALHDYATELDDATFTLPVGGLKSLEFLAAISRAGCFMLAADKGPNLISALRSGRHDEIDKHGAVSVSVNFHALGRIVDRLGGRTWGQNHPYHRLNTCAFQLGGEAAAFPAFGRAFSNEVLDFGPDDFANLKDALLASKEALTATALFSFLRLSNWDPEMVMSFLSRLAEVVPGCSTSVQQAFVEGFQSAWALHYALDSNIRFGFLLGGLCASIGHFGSALRFYVASMQEEGTAADTVYNGALCLARMEAYEECRRWLRHAAGLGVPQEEIDLVLAECE